MILSANAVVIAQDDVDTDVLFPGPYLSITDVAQMPQYLFEGLDPSLRDQLVGPTALVVGANFGCGSSREHVPQAMRGVGHPVPRRAQLRPHLLAQLPQPRACRS